MEPCSDIVDNALVYLYKPLNLIRTTGDPFSQQENDKFMMN